MTTDTHSGFVSTLLRRLTPEIHVSFRNTPGAPSPTDAAHGGQMRFHITDKTTTWLYLPGQTPRAIPPNHVLILPWDSPHALAHRGDLAPPLKGAGTEDPSPSEASSLVCGFIDIDPTSKRLLHGALPEVLVVPAMDDPLGELTRLLFREAARNAPNDDPMLLKLAETLLMYALRTGLERHAPQAQGLSAALAHPRLSTALDAMLQAPERHWTVAELAKRAHLSRSGFAQCFRDTVGRGPIDVLTEWRMQYARRLLKYDGACVPDVAERCGYRSEAAFARAFKRIMGYGPGEARHRNTSATDSLQGASVRY